MFYENSFANRLPGKTYTLRQPLKHETVPQSPGQTVETNCFASVQRRRFSERLAKRFRRFYRTRLDDRSNVEPNALFSRNGSPGVFTTTRPFRNKVARLDERARGVSGSAPTIVKRFYDS